MQIKTDLNVAMRKDQFKINAGGKDLVTKTTWLLSALWYLHKLVILTRDNVSPTGQPTSCPAESMDRDGYPKSLLSRQQYYGTYHVDNSPNQGFYRHTTSFIAILNRGRHPALWKWRLTPCWLHARTHARSLTVTQVILILSPSCPPPTPSLLPPSLLFASCYSLYAYSQLPTLASHSEEIID
jgi:hypothetical protein